MGPTFDASAIARSGALQLPPSVVQFFARRKGVSCTRPPARPGAVSISGQMLAQELFHCGIEFDPVVEEAETVPFPTLKLHLMRDLCRLSSRIRFFDWATDAPAGHGRQPEDNPAPRPIRGRTIGHGRIGEPVAGSSD